MLDAGERQKQTITVKGTRVRKMEKRENQQHDFRVPAGGERRGQKGISQPNKRGMGLG